MQAWANSFMVEWAYFSGETSEGEGRAGEVIYTYTIFYSLP